MSWEGELSTKAIPGCRVPGVMGGEGTGAEDWPQGPDPMLGPLAPRGLTPPSHWEEAQPWPASEQRVHGASGDPVPWSG